MGRRIRGSSGIASVLRCAFQALLPPPATPSQANRSSSLKPFTSPGRDGNWYQVRHGVRVDDRIRFFLPQSYRGDTGGRKGRPLS